MNLFRTDTKITNFSMYIYNNKEIKDYLFYDLKQTILYVETYHWYAFYYLKIVSVFGHLQ